MLLVGSILCLYDCSSGDLPVLNCASVRRVLRVSACSVSEMGGAS